MIAEKYYGLIRFDFSVLVPVYLVFGFLLRPMYRFLEPKDLAIILGYYRTERFEGPLETVC
jgi:hypothetical protein